MISLAYKISHCLSANHYPELRYVICTGVTLFALELHCSQNRVIFSCVLLRQKQELILKPLVQKVGKFVISKYQKGAITILSKLNKYIM